MIGSGIAGLALGYRLMGRHDVLVLEREAFAGGKIHSQEIDGYLFEWGPNGFLSSATELRALVGELGLEGDLTEAGPSASKRFIYWNGALHPLPTGPRDLLSMTLLSTGGKLRALGELFVGHPSGDEATREETVYRFFERRFGPEVAERMVAPALLGITGGDARKTSLDALFPRLRELETEHLSVVRGMMRGPRGRAGRLTSFGSKGMQRLTGRLAEKLGGKIRYNAAAKRIDPLSAGWLVTFEGGETYADTVVIAAPADVAASLVQHFDAPLAENLRSIGYAPMRAIGVAYRQEDVPMPLDGFGFLVARRQGIRILGALYTSSIFPTQAPPGTAYFRIFLGGATDPDALSLDAAEVQQTVRDDLAKTIGITARPLVFHEAIWPRAIPQYTLDHRAVMFSIDRRLKNYRGLSLAGNAYRGLGLGDNVRDALSVAAALNDTPTEHSLSV